MRIVRCCPKEILAESFRELAADRAIDKITVQEIVSNCAYSSATFYRHFKDKYDLIAWDYAQKAAEIMDRLNEKDYLWGQALLDWAAYFQQEKELTFFRFPVRYKQWLCTIKRHKIKNGFDNDKNRIPAGVSGQED